MEQKVENNFKKNKIFICIFGVAVIWAFFYFITELLYRKVSIVKDDFSCDYQFESVKKEEGKILIEGWMFECEKDSSNPNFEIILFDKKNNKFYYPKMIYYDREDVNEYFLCEYNYTHCGFLASFNIESEENYLILLRKRKSLKSAYDTNIYISEGKLFYSNPEEFQSLDIEGTNLGEIVNMGILRLYLPEYGVYIYQKDESLFWILEQNYDVSEFENRKIRCFIYSTQRNKLVEAGVNGEKEVCSFIFTDNELEGNYGKYKVAEVSISKLYAIKHIVTGEPLNSNDWKWKKKIRPFYDFNKK